MKDTIKQIEYFSDNIDFGTATSYDDCVKLFADICKYQQDRVNRFIQKHKNADNISFAIYIEQDTCELCCDVKFTRSMTPAEIERRNLIINVQNQNLKEPNGKNI